MKAFKMLLDFEIFSGWWWWWWGWWWSGCPQTSLQRIAPSTIAETLPRALLKVWPCPSPPDIPPADGALDAIVNSPPRALPIVWALASVSSAAVHRLSESHPMITFGQVVFLLPEERKFILLYLEAYNFLSLL